MILAYTESVRQALRAEGGDIKPFTPQLTLDIGTPISQVAFSSDESALVLSAEHGGGLAIYNVDDLMQGNKRTSFEMSTDSTAVRALIPNPAVKNAESFAVVTAKGQLLVANVKEGRWLENPNGQVLKDGVSCISWSKLGKQLVAGLADGSASQMRPNGAPLLADGSPQKVIPRPAKIEGNQHGKPLTHLLVV